MTPRGCAHIAALTRVQLLPLTQPHVMIQDVWRRRPAFTTKLSLPVLRFQWQAGCAQSCPAGAVTQSTPKSVMLPNNARQAREVAEVVDAQTMSAVIGPPVLSHGPLQVHIESGDVRRGAGQEIEEETA